MDISFNLIRELEEYSASGINDSENSHGNHNASLNVDTPKSLEAHSTNEEFGEKELLIDGANGKERPNNKEAILASVPEMKNSIRATY